MVRDTIGHGFDKHRLATVLQCHFSCFLCGLSDRPNVVSVNSNGVNSISNSSACNAISSILIEGGCGNGKSVVAADEDDRTRACGSNVQGGMEIALTGSSLTEEDGRYSRL
jgi:hypothetical protein